VLLDRLQVALSAPLRERPPPDDFSDVPSLRALAGSPPRRPLGLP
jgi:hypothetical protein